MRFANFEPATRMLFPCLRPPHLTQVYEDTLSGASVHCIAFCGPSQDAPSHGENRGSSLLGSASVISSLR